MGRQPRARCWWTMSICAERRLTAHGSRQELGVSSRWGALSLLLSASCFEVSQVAVEPAPPALEVDDFEDGDNVPSSSLFATWRCETLSGPPRASCGSVAPGFGGGMAEAVRFELTDPANGVTDYTGVLLEVATRLDPVDLRGYDELAFSAKFERAPSGGASLDPGAEGSDPADFFVQLVCDAVGQSGALPYGSWLEYAIPIGPEWSSPSVELDELVRPDFVVNFDRLDCLANVEAVVFLLGPELADGETLAGTLTLDEISLR